MRSRADELGGRRQEGLPGREPVSGSVGRDGAVRAAGRWTRIRLQRATGGNGGPADTSLGFIVFLQGTAGFFVSIAALLVGYIERADLI